MTPEPDPEPVAWNARVTFTNNNSGTRKIFFARSLYPDNTPINQITDLVQFDIPEDGDLAVGLWAYTLISNRSVVAVVTVPGGESIYPYFSRSDTTLVSEYFTATPSLPWSDGFATNNEGTVVSPPVNANVLEEDEYER